MSTLTLLGTVNVPLAYQSGMVISYLLLFALGLIGGAVIGRR